MNEIVWLLTMHGYWLLFLCVLGRQACLPIPANLFVLAAGALAGFLDKENDITDSFRRIWANFDGIGIDADVRFRRRIVQTYPTMIAHFR